MGQRLKWTAAERARLGRLVKSVIDIVGALVLLVVTFPLMALVTAAIGASMGRPILFRQDRVGLGGRSFTLLKFRTMRPVHSGADELASDNQRLTALGRVLRACSLDELPQLWNVLRGDMSLVGPRPLLTQYVGRYSSRQARRHEVKPGLTGLAQVRGRNGLSWEERFELDVWYVDHQSVGLDLKILLRTAVSVFGGRGVSAPGHATMPEFLGSGHADGVR